MGLEDISVVFKGVLMTGSVKRDLVKKNDTITQYVIHEEEEIQVASGRLCETQRLSECSASRWMDRGGS